MNDAPASVWRLAKDRSISLDTPRIMAILNVTPDSFSDGGLHDTPERASEYALECIAAGADIIDIGGESTRPGAAIVDENEQITRVIPVIELILSSQTDALISVDTRSAVVARAALEAGAVIINDVSGGRDDPSILNLAADADAGLILMHRPRPSDAEVYSHEYDEANRPRYSEGVVHAVCEGLSECARKAIQAGVSPPQIVLDPGLGFGKTVEQNLELIRRVGEIEEVGYPVLSAASRKSFIGHVGAEPEPDRRSAGTLAISLFHFTLGIRLFRVHDVAAHRQAFRIAAQISTSPIPVSPADTLGQ